MQLLQCPPLKNSDNMLTNISWFPQPVGHVLNTFYWLDIIYLWFMLALKTTVLKSLNFNSAI